VKKVQCEKGKLNKFGCESITLFLNLKYKIIKLIE